MKNKKTSNKVTEEKVGRKVLKIIFPIVLLFIFVQKGYEHFNEDGISLGSVLEFGLLVILTLIILFLVIQLIIKLEEKFF